jgi:signal transduction histidine kinase
MALGGPALAILIASLISVVRDTRLLSLEARSEMRSVLADQLRLMRTLRELERRTKSILNITQPEPISQEPEVAVGTAVTVEAGAPASKALTADTALSMDTADIIDSTTSEAALIEAEVNPLESLTALSSESLSEQDGKSIGVPELSNLLEAVIQEVRASRAENHQGTKVRFIVSGALDSAVAVSVRGVKETLTDVLRALILHSAESIGGGSDGVVRATWRLNVANVQLIIEDNGRGMSEDLLLRLEEKNQSGTGRLRLAQVRAQLAEVEGRVELSARLGVGSRIVLELQRTDALVASTAPQKPRTAPIRQAREPIAIGREALQTN